MSYYLYPRYGLDDNIAGRNPAVTVPVPVIDAVQTASMEKYYDTNFKRGLGQGWK